MFKTVKYYNSANDMPIGRYMLAICKSVSYYAVDCLPKKINQKKLNKSLKQFNKTLIKNTEQKQLFKDIKQLEKDEAVLYMQSVLISIIAYCNSLIFAGVQESVIEEKLKPIQSILIRQGITADSKRNTNRLEKYSRNFKIKSEQLQKSLKNDEVKYDLIYEAYLRNLILIERFFGVKINEKTDSVNKYILLIDELKKKRNNGNRHK